MSSLKGRLGCGSCNIKTVVTHLRDPSAPVRLEVLNAKCQSSDGDGIFLRKWV